MMEQYFIVLSLILLLRVVTQVVRKLSYFSFSSEILITFYSQMLIGTGHGGESVYGEPFKVLN